MLNLRRQAGFNLLVRQKQAGMKISLRGINYVGRMTGLRAHICIWALGFESL